MASVYDVAQYILRECGTMTTMKLQKLVYYSQAWHLAWTENPLFNEPIEAWKDGPVCPDLYHLHKGNFKISALRKGNPHNLSEDEVESISIVLSHYGEKGPQWLSDMTHMEDPWKNARRGVKDGEACNAIITHQSMCEYYASI